MSQNKEANNVNLSPATIAVHGCEQTDEQQFSAVVSPMFHSATFAFENFAEMWELRQPKI